LARLLEYQGKDIFRRFKIPTPKGKVVRSVEEAQVAASEIGYPLVVKAQVYAGKRGKSGGIRVVNDENDLRSAVASMLSSTVRGLRTDTLLIEEKMDVKQEIYVGVTADPTNRSPVVVVCGDGGVDIEETARHKPEALLKFRVDISRGLQSYDALNLLRDVPGMSSREKLAVARIICSLYALYRRHDCKLVEINPLALADDRVVALDARVDIDDDSVSRQTSLNIEMAEEAGNRSATVLEKIAGQIDHNDHRGTVHFVQIDPALSYIRAHDMIPIAFDCVGAGASLATMDELVPLGFYPVDFCDTSGNPVGSKMYRITRIIFSQPGIERYVFVSCISSQQLDNTARGIIKALKDIYLETGGQPNIPTVLAFRGAWDEDSIKLLADHGISAGRWVRVLGRNATEQSAAEAFAALHREWKTERGRPQ